MKSSAGLWIDHRQAVIVSGSDKWTAAKVVKSDVKNQYGRIGGVHATAPDDRLQSSYTAHMNGYYDEVASAIRGAESILIFGPGEAKNELKKRLAKIKKGKFTVAVQTAGKMTRPQISAKVRKYFQK